MSDGIYLYRHWNAEGILLYVGITKNLVTRKSNHSKLAHWWPEVNGITSEGPMSECLARLKEKETIFKEKPLYNVNFNDDSTLAKYKINLQSDLLNYLAERFIKENTTIITFSLNELGLLLIPKGLYNIAKEKLVLTTIQSLISAYLIQVQLRKKSGNDIIYTISFYKDIVNTAKHYKRRYYTDNVKTLADDFITIKDMIEDQ